MSVRICAGAGAGAGGDGDGGSSISSSTSTSSNTTTSGSTCTNSGDGIENHGFTKAMKGIFCGLNINCICSHIWSAGRRRPKSVEISESASAFQNGRDLIPSIRLASFDAAIFSMAPAVPDAGARRTRATAELNSRERLASFNDPPKGILKQRSYKKSKMRVSINLPDNEISLEKTKQSNSGKFDRGKGPVSGVLMSVPSSPSFRLGSGDFDVPKSARTVMDVLREVNADVVALQNVKAEEEKGMKPLSDLAEGLGMEYVFAESWAPEYGNAILSKWPIKKYQVQKIFDDSDYRNVLKATIDVPVAGEINFHCTHLDHLNENWRMKQIQKILESSGEEPHILAGGFNSLNEDDYSEHRWNDIVKYYEEIGKPTPKVEVMRFLRDRQYLDAKNFAGESESVVVIAKGQDVQGTCKYGTRVDYILASPNSPYKFVPGSYTVLSSKGTSDHHIVKVDIKVAHVSKLASKSKSKSRSNVVKINKAMPSRGIWNITDD